MEGCARCHVCRWVRSALPDACCDVRAALLVVVRCGCQKKKACVGHASEMPPARAVKLIFYAKSLSNWDLELRLLDLEVES